MRLGRGELRRQFSDAAEGDLRAADHRQGADQVFQRTFHVQQHQNKTAHHGFVSAGPERLQGQRQTDDHKEQHRAETLGNHERVDRFDLGLADETGSALDAAVEHALAARAMNAQFLGAFGNRVVVLLQFVFSLTGGEEALDPATLGEVLDASADQDRHNHDQEHWPRQHRQVAHATEGDGQRDGQGGEGEGEVADGVNVMRQHRNQAMAAIAFNLLDRCRQHFLTQLFAQGGDDVLADIVGADVGTDRAEQCQHAQAAEQRDYALGQTGFGVQRIIDGGQQDRDTQATDHTQNDRQCDDEPKRFE